VLKDVTARAAQPREKQYKLSDSEGLYLLVKPAGKYWRWDCSFAGKRKVVIH